ncbi:MAG: gamma-glutamyl-gamma-aminobutyrate hydrolase family protein [Limisphaerales bacterium]
MSRARILVTGCYDSRGSEFGDASISLSNCYGEAVIAAGGLPLIFPVSARRKDVSEYVGLVDGLLITGGEDIYPDNYTESLPLEVAETIRPGSRRRDELEIALIHETFAQRKALFAICRGHQLLNIAMGGTLIADLALERPETISHRDRAQGCRHTHPIVVESDSLAAELLGRHDVIVNSSHHQAVAESADGLRSTAKTKDGVVEIMELDDPERLPFCVSVQFHPERFQEQNPGYKSLFQRFISSAGDTD